MTEDLPDARVEAALERRAGRWTLRLERLLDHPPERVLSALTRADQIRRWAPYAPEHDLDQVGEVALPLAEHGEPADGPAGPGRVVDVDAPRLLVLRWGDQVLRYDLVETPGGVRLVLTHTFDDPAAADYAAGWHLCLGALAAGLAGLDVPPVAGSAAHDHGWGALREEYARLLAPGATSDASSPA